MEREKQDLSGLCHWAQGSVRVGVERGGVRRQRSLGSGPRYSLGKALGEVQNLAPGEARSWQLTQ